jgi:hypothetical protein
MSKDSFVIIQSKYRTPESKSSSDFSFFIGIAQDVKAVAIKSVTIPHLHTNINSYNNTLILLYGTASTATIIMPIGQYNIVEFMSALQALIIAETGDGTFVITQDSLTNKLNFSGNQQVIAFSTDLTLSPLTKIIGAYDTLSTIFPNPKSFSFTVPHVPDLYGVKNYYVTSRTLSGGYNCVTRGGKQIPLILVVPVEEGYGELSHYEPQSIELDKKVFTSNQNVQYMDIQILDDNFRVVDLHGGDVEITLIIYSDRNRL